MLTTLTQYVLPRELRQETHTYKFFECAVCRQNEQNAISCDALANHALLNL